MLHQTILADRAGFPQAHRPKVYSYSRWSTPEQAKGDSSRRQSEGARKWAERMGLELDESLAIVDHGVSAYRGGNAVDGGLGRFLEACRRDLIDEGSYLLVESLDRISRMAPRKAQAIINEIVDSGVTIVTLGDGQMYNAERLDADPISLIVALLVSWRAHDESKTKGRRVAEAWAEKRRKVRSGESSKLTNRAPVWLRPAADGSWELDEERVATIRRIFAMTLAGVGENKIAATFNLEDVPVLGRGKKAGKRWHRTTVAKMLRHPGVVGSLVPGRIEYIEGRKVNVKEEPIPNAFPAIISEADWLAVRALKDGKATTARGRHAGKPVVHFFAGLTKCPECGAAMTRVNKGAKGKAGLPKLVCAAAKTKVGCRYVSVSVKDVEEAFREGWGSLFANIPAGDHAAHLDDEYNGLQASIEGREDHLRDLMEAAEAAPSASLARAIAKSEAELVTLRAQLLEADEARRMADRGLIDARMRQLAGLLEPEPTEQEPNPAHDWGAINALLKVLFRGVVVDYRLGSLRFEWRQGGEASINYAWPS